MLISVENPETADLEKSYLATNYSAGINAIQVKNSDRIINNSRIMIGEMGQEKTEVVTVTNQDPDGIDLSVSTTVFPHSADDPVYVLRFDQIKFYRSTSGENGVYSLVSTQPLDVDNEDLETKYDDTSGLASYFYYNTFFHSLSSLESANGDIIGGSGWGRKQVGNIIDEIQQEVSDPNSLIVTRNEILGFFNDVNDDITTDGAKPPEYLKRELSLNRVANSKTIAYPLNDDGTPKMWKFHHMDYEFLDPTTSPITDRTKTIKCIPNYEFRNMFPDNIINTTTVSDRKPERMTLDDFTDEFIFSNAAATNATGVFKLYYYKFFDQIVSEGDVVETYTPKIYKLYAKQMYYRKRAITESSYTATADRWAADYRIELNKHRSHNRKDVGSKRSFRAPANINRGYRRHRSGR